MLFQSDIAHIDSEINQLLAQVEAARQKQAQLTELDALTDSSLTQLKDVVSKIKHNVPGAIASLKTAVLDLFAPGDHGQDDEPSFIDEDSLEYPTLEGQFCDIGHDLDWYWERCAKPEGQAWEFASPLTCSLWEDAPLTGQSCEWASPLCSLVWEDAPLKGQYCTITSSATGDNGYKSTKGGERMPYVEFVEVSDKVGYLKVTHSGEIKAAYAGFTRKDRAEAWGRLLAVTYEIASGFEVRPAKHLPFKWELKLWDMNINQIQKLAAEDLAKSPRVEANSSQSSKSESLFTAAEIAVGSSIRVLSWQGHDCNQSSDIATVLEIEDGMYRIDVKNRQGINIWLSLHAITPLSETLPTPAQAAGIEPPAGWRQVQAQAESLPTMPTKKARISLESSPWKGQDCEVLEVTPDGRWWKLRLPNGQELKYPSDTIEPVVEATEKIEFNDLVEVIADGNDCVGLVGSFGRVKILGESRIGVEIDEQLVYLKPSELRIKAKEEKAPRRQSLQSGQLLTGNRILTTGNYIGLRRSAASFNTAERIATIQLAKDLKNLGFDPQLAATVMAGDDDASDF